MRSCSAASTSAAATGWRWPTCARCSRGWAAPTSRTHLNSGNAVVTAEPDGLAERVEQALPLPVRVVVFTAAELAAAVAGCPWPERAAAEPKLVHVGYLDRLPDPQALAALGTEHGGDRLAVGPRVLYLSYAERSVDTPLATALSEARLDVVLTTRNWTTATRLVALTS